jgi:hypothetical protein
MQPAPAQPEDPPSPAPSLPAAAVTSRGVDACGLSEILDQMAPATLAQLDDVSLLDRFDTKFLLTESQLVSVLPSLARDYRVLDIEERRLHRYRTLYFDTSNLDLYRQHLAGRAIRHKVRSREYVDTGLSFFEIKSKTVARRTVKHRFATPEFLTDLTSDAHAFVTSHLPSDARTLQPTLRNQFLRVTLVGKRCAERLTLDVNVQFDCDERTAILPGIAIVELKQSTTNEASPFLQAMHAAQIRPTSISKYCVGVGLLVTDVEHDAFAEMLKTIEDLTRDQSEAQATAALDVLSAGTSII